MWKKTWVFLFRTKPSADFDQWLVEMVRKCFTITVLLESQCSSTPRTVLCHEQNPSSSADKGVLITLLPLVFRQRKGRRDWRSQRLLCCKWHFVQWCHTSYSQWRHWRVFEEDKGAAEVKGETAPCWASWVALLSGSRKHDPRKWV